MLLLVQVTFFDISSKTRKNEVLKVVDMTDVDIPKLGETIRSMSAEVLEEYATYFTVMGYTEPAISVKPLPHIKGELASKLISSTLLPSTDLIHISEEEFFNKIKGL